MVHNKKILLTDSQVRKLDIYGVKIRLIRFLSMFKIHIFSIMPFRRFLEKYKFNNFLPTFFHLLSKIFVDAFKTFTSDKVCHFEQ